jgi:hypothetical protein
LPHPGYLLCDQDFREKAGRNEGAQSVLYIENWQHKMEQVKIALKKNIVSSSGYM